MFFFLFCVSNLSRSITPLLSRITRHPPFAYFLSPSSWIGCVRHSSHTESQPPLPRRALLLHHQRSRAEQKQSAEICSEVDGEVSSKKRGSGRRPQRDMWTPSRGSASGRRATGHRRIADYLADDRTEASTENGSFNTAYSDELFAPTSSSAGGDGVGGMLPAFLADQSDLVEVMLELDEESMVVRSVTPTTGALYGPTSLAGGGAAHTPPGSGRSLSRCSSTSSRIRKKFAWLRSPSPAPAPRAPTPSEPPPPREAAMAARERRRIQARLNRSRSGARRALKGLRFISRTTGSAEAAELWTRVEHRFNALSRDGLLSRDNFGDCIGMEDSKEFAVGIFDALARRRRQELERISKEELYDFWVQISDQSFDARLQIFFDMVDTNVDGRITREEVQEATDRAERVGEQAVEAEGAGGGVRVADHGGARPGGPRLHRAVAAGGAAAPARRVHELQPAAQQRQHGAVEPEPRRRRRRAARRARAGAGAVAAEENWRRAWVLALWFAAMAGLFAWKFVQYRRTPAFRVMGYCLPTAKGAAETLKLNMALVLLPVCRNTLTWLRSSWARFFVPFDDSITFHKIIATAIALGICTHAGTHLACDFPRLIGSSREEYELLLSGFFGASRPTYRGLLAGVEGVTGIVMVVLMVVSFTLATRPLRKREAPRLPFPLGHLAGFNAFWYSHHLLIVVYLLLLVHGWFMFLVTKWHQRTTWMYIAVPLMLYVGERTLRAFRSKAYAVKILKVCLLPGNVLTITMSKPYGFRYRSGQYIFLQCPTISPFEWHPFSITSAPGDDYISVHIQTRGDWTQELKRIFVENYFVPSVPRRASFGALGMAEQKSPPRLLVDGPYGAPAQDFRNYDVLLLVGLGIGATPFISILRDLLNNIKLADELMDLAMETSRSDDSANSFSVSTASSNKRRAYRTSRAHFYWVTREPGSFEWFKGVIMLFAVAIRVS
ncbi:Os08g0453700 [Oryza sativa Japonica Group]|uniref:Os08g0453700 protein n=1 Tax=Oryza sativa subsp. japonica TaxID=39947 RepID=A0A0P0XGC6_ORYSJ|nr:hypothetical protein EE612_044658 [Oryza sativa]BAT05718.1 Os08g0453700 [Oryza sativa Japonica Group]